MNKEILDIMLKPASDFTVNQRRLDTHWAKCRLIGMSLPCLQCEKLEDIVIEEAKKDE